MTMSTFLYKLYEVLPCIYERLSCHDVNCLLDALEKDEPDRFCMEDHLTVALVARLHHVQKPATVLFEWIDCITDSAAVIDRALSSIACRKLCEQASRERDELDPEKGMPENVEKWSLASMIADGTCARPFLMFVADANAEVDVYFREGCLALVKLLAGKGIMSVAQYEDFLVHLMDEACFRNDTPLLRMAATHYKNLPVSSAPPREDDEDVIARRKKMASEMIVIAIDAGFGQGNENAIVERIDLLVTELGADPHFSPSSSKTGVYFTPLSKACSEGLEKVARHLVKKYGVRPMTGDGVQCCLKTARSSENKTLERFIVREMYNF